MTTLNSNYGKVKEWPGEGRSKPKYPIGTQIMDKMDSASVKAMNVNLK